MKTRNLYPSLLVIAGAVTLWGSGCAVEESSVLVVGNEFVSGSSCESSPSLDGPFLTRGVLDVSIARRYVMRPVLQNQLGRSADVKITPAGGAGGGGGGSMGAGLDDVLIEGNTVILQTADVEFELPSGVALQFPSSLTIPTSGTIFPQGVASTGLEIISPDLGNQLASQINQRGLLVTMLVKVKFAGTTATGTEVVSTEMSYPLDVCFGCLVTYAPGTLFESDANKLTCDPLAKPPEAEVPDEPDPPCLVGQDIPVDCRLCRAVKDTSALADSECDPP